MSTKFKTGFIRAWDENATTIFKEVFFHLTDKLFQKTNHHFH